MDSKVAAELIPPVYEDFDPSSEMIFEKDFDTILLNLPGFRKDHLKVQLTTSKILRISGSRLVEGNKWRRFQKEFPVTPGRDPQRISAKFEGGILYVKVPMLIPTPGKKEENPPIITTTDDQKGTSDYKEQQHTDDKKHDHHPSLIAEPIDSSGKKDYYNLEKKSNQEEKKEEEDDDNKLKNKEEKTRSLVEESKEMKSIAGKDDGDINIRNESFEKREKENLADQNSNDQANQDVVDDDKTRGENLQINDASKLKKDRRMLNVVLVAMLAIAIGLYVSDFFKSLRRIKY